MKLSLNWIKDFVDYSIDRQAQDLGDLISLSVAEVEDVLEAGSALSQVKTVKVIACEPHPEADRLQLATLDTGSETRKIVCGAKNCRPGITVPFADLGAKLPIIDKQGKPAILEIKKAKIRGFESTGMLCSEAELGLADEAPGILEMDNDLPAGVSLSELPQYAKWRDILFDIDNKSLTHRPDLWGHYGFAREFAAIFDLSLKAYPGLKVEAKGGSGFTVNVNSENCRRYSALRIKNVTVGESPEWMTTRLTNAGINSINNMVDLTNYVLLELGQPMHAFDVAKLTGTELEVRQAQAGEKFSALDEKEYELNEEDMVISIGGRAEALAGVIGGGLSAIDENTNEILLECASFNAAPVRRAASRHGIRTDSSSRFEKSLDPENTPIALERIWQLIKELCPNAELVGGLEDCFTQPYPEITIETSQAFIEKRLGCDIGQEFIHGKLKTLGFGLEGDLSVTVPSWRRTKDVSIQEDLVEEIGRLYGFDNISSEALSSENRIPVINHARSLERQVKEMLSSGHGLTEIMTYPWCGQDELDAFGLSSDGLMTLLNPVSEDATFMKPNNMPKIIRAVSENIKYAADVRLYDFNRIYDTTQMVQELLPTERFQFTGALAPAPAGKKNLQTESFFETKALVGDVLKLAGVSTWQIQNFPDNELASWVHPGINCQFRRGRQLLAEVFKLHPAIAEKNHIKHNVYIFVIHFDEIAKVGGPKYKYQITSKYPTVPFDITVATQPRVLAGKVEALIRKGGAKSLLDLDVVSVYEREETKNISFRMHFGAKDHTLSHDEIHELQKKIVASILKGGFEIPNLPDDLK